MARKCNASGCRFYLPDKYPLDNVHAPGQGQLRSQLYLQLLLPVWAAVLLIRSLGLIRARRSCAGNTKTVASVIAMRPRPNRSRKPLRFARERLQSLGNGHANERELKNNRSGKQEGGISAETADATATPAARAGQIFHRSKKLFKLSRLRPASFTIPPIVIAFTGLWRGTVMKRVPSSLQCACPDAQP